MLMKIILLGYSGLLGGHILSELAEHLKKIITLA